MKLWSSHVARVLYLGLVRVRRLEKRRRFVGDEHAATKGETEHGSGDKWVVQERGKSMEITREDWR